MITVAQAKEALDSLYEASLFKHNEADFFILEEFIKQYEDWVKVKKLANGALLKGKEDE